MCAHFKHIFKGIDAPDWYWCMVLITIDDCNTYSLAALVCAGLKGLLTYLHSVSIMLPMRSHLYASTSRAIMIFQTCTYEWHGDSLVHMYTNKPRRPISSPITTSIIWMAHYFNYKCDRKGLFVVLENPKSLKLVGWDTATSTCFVHPIVVSLV